MASYTVVQGDNLTRIARANGLTLAELIALNPQYADNPDLIHIGDVVNLGGEATSTGGSASSTSGGTVTPEMVKQWFSDAGADIGFETNETPDERAKRIADSINSGERSEAQVKSSIAGIYERMQLVTADDSPGAPPQGEEEDIPGIMSGGTILKIVRPDQDDIWAIAYNIGGTRHVYSFSSLDEMYAALGPDALTSGAFPYEQIGEREFDAGQLDGSIFNMGSAAPLVGQTGAYANFYQDLSQDAAISAGIRNPGMLGRYLADPEIQAILGASIAGGWSELRTSAEIRNTNFYQNVMYPGISAILDKGSDAPEAEWWQYHNAVEDNLQMLGYQKDDDGSYRSSIGKLLGQGISDTVFNQMAPVYQRAATDETFATTLDYWLDQTAGRDVTFDDIFDALAGQASGDLQVAVESAIIQYHSDRYTTTLSPDQISRIAAQTNLSEPEVARAFSTSEEALLALGNQGLERYGLTEEALVNAAFELGTGDFNAVEVRRLANKTTKELGLADDTKAQFYSSFNERGALVKPGLGAASPEHG